ncbi:MAG: hypothetical protein JSS43_22505 [Proteobacteria bacterium]|nr:hypothetical protein [Pseudomonadota bacterium]
MPAETAAAVPGRMAMRAVLAVCLGGGIAVLAACTPYAPCETSFRGGCVAGAPVQRPFWQSTPPATASAPGAPATQGAAPASPAVPLGDPATFADVDDKQCRSYGLIFGTRDYADCRIRLSAQHRGLDPNIGATAQPGK